MSAHALLGPSSAERWLACTPSARAAENEPDKRSGFADEGSFAHSVAEHCLRNAVRPDQLCGVKPWEDSEYWTQDLRDHVCTYLDYINDVLAATPPGATAFIEQKFDLSQYAPESFGTADCVVIADKVMHTIDLKFGKGLLVDAYDNSQLKLYALGAYSTYGFMYDVETVRLHIVQPRISGNPVPYDMPLEELLAWGESIKQRAQLAWNGEGEFVPGEHCMFCRIKGKCKARSEQMTVFYQQNSWRQAQQMTLPDIAELLPSLDQLITWAKDVQEYALEQAKDGKRVPGFKLVAGTSRRKITDEPAVAKLVMTEGHSPYKPQELLGITELEKTVGKKRFAEMCGQYLAKPPGKETLVPESDSRPALESNAASDADFENVA